MCTRVRSLIVVLALPLSACGSSPRAAPPHPAAAEADRLPVADGYRGLWFSGKSKDPRHPFKYSGGLGLYPYQNVPVAVYSATAKKTFFCWGGAPAGDPRRQVNLISYYDHATGRVPRPRILVDRGVEDGHDNPTMTIDGAGHLWVFTNNRRDGRPAIVWRSARPYDVDRFEKVREDDFMYAQPWHVPGRGLLLLFTIRTPPENPLFLRTIADGGDGHRFGDPVPFARIGAGDYQVSWRRGAVVGTAFDDHPIGLGQEARTNLYYLETDDAGATWRTASGEPVSLPVSERGGPALVKRYDELGQLVFLQDLTFDEGGRPVILFLTTGGIAPGPESGPRVWRTARWTGAGWDLRDVTASDHNYDHGSLDIDGAGVWRVIGPTEPGPQPGMTGGEMVLWTSRDRGESWSARPLTRRSRTNHSFARRPVDAHPDFVALWADGDPAAVSPSSLYFTDREGKQVWRLPPVMAGDEAMPERLPERNDD